MGSAVGRVLAYNAAAPKYADLAGGYDYALVIANQTAADIVTGTVEIETAVAKADDACAPDDTSWVHMHVQPECDAPLGTQGVDAEVTFSATNPLKANSQCQYSIPCPSQFVRASGVPTGAEAIVVVVGLKRAGSPGDPANMQVRSATAAQPQGQLQTQRSPQLQQQRQQPQPTSRAKAEA